MENYLPTVWTAIYPKILILAILMGIDFLIGVVVALVYHEFDWQKLNHYMISDLLPILGWVVVILLACLPVAFLPEGKVLPVVPDIVYGGLILGITASIFQTLAKIGILKNQLAVLHIPYAVKLKPK